MFKPLRENSQEGTKESSQTQVPDLKCFFFQNTDDLNLIIDGLMSSADTIVRVGSCVHCNAM